MEKLDKKIDKIKIASSLNEISYAVLASKLAVTYIKKKFPHFENLESLKKNKQIIKGIMKIIDTILKDKAVFTDREAVKKLDKVQICINICKIILVLTPEEEEIALEDIKFIVEEFYKKKSFFLSLFKRLRRLFGA
jgi:hypothetical protein